MCNVNSRTPCRSPFTEPPSTCTPRPESSLQTLKNQMSTLFYFSEFLPHLSVSPPLVISFLYASQPPLILLPRPHRLLRLHRFTHHGAFGTLLSPIPGESWERFWVEETEGSSTHETGGYTTNHVSLRQRHYHF